MTPTRPGSGQISLQDRDTCLEHGAVNDAPEGLADPPPQPAQDAGALRDLLADALRF